MANYNRQVPRNVVGEFFVDSTCINCKACRQLAPETFDEDETGDAWFVNAQPQTPEGRCPRLWQVSAPALG